MNHKRAIPRPSGGAHEERPAGRVCDQSIHTDALPLGPRVPPREALGHRQNQGATKSGEEPEA